MREPWFRWRKPRTIVWVQGLFLILIVFAFTAPALAHRVLVFAFAEGDTIHTESKFVPSTPVRQGQVQVLEPKTGQILLTGKTDDKGKFSFKIPAAAAAQKLDLKIVVEAAMGHKGEWLLKAENYLTGVKPEKAATPAVPAPAATPAPAVPGSKAAAVNRQVLEEAVNKALERQLAPVKEMLTELTLHRTSLPDILGGIGYILGIFGLWAYFLSKRKKTS
jgi:nickel transport protein